MTPSPSPTQFFALKSHPEVTPPPTTHSPTTAPGANPHLQHPNSVHFPSNFVLLACFVYQFLAVRLCKYRHSSPFQSQSSKSAYLQVNIRVVFVAFHLNHWPPELHFNPLTSVETVVSVPHLPSGQLPSNPPIMAQSDDFHPAAASKMQPRQNLRATKSGTEPGAFETWAGRDHTLIYPVFS